MLRGFIAGLVVANAFEWVAHKYVLHGTHRKGKPRFSPLPTSMKSHWEHHKVVRKVNFYDDAYTQGLSHWRTENEVISVCIAAGVFGAAFYPFSKGMALAACYSACNYYYTHRRAHLEPEWARKKIPWHYDHHMNSNQDANWCVTKPWFDYVMGTRVISSSALQESNPLGIPLPTILSDRLNQFSKRYLPARWVAVENQTPDGLELEESCVKTGI